MAMLNIHEDTPIKVLKSVFNSYDDDKNGTLDKGLILFICCKSVQTKLLHTAYL